MRDFLDFLKFAGPFLLGIALLFVGVVLLVGSGVKYQCKQYAEMTGRPTKYAALTCYVQDNGKWYGYEEYKMANVAELRGK